MSQATPLLFEKRRVLLVAGIISVIYVVLFILTAGARDTEITLTINAWAVTTPPEFQAIMRIYTLYSYYVGGGVIYLLLIASLKVERLQPHRAFLVSYAIGIGFVLIASSLLKLIIMRPRPASTYKIPTLGLDIPPDSSFPSVHASVGFALATPPTCRFKNWTLRVLLAVYAVCLAFTRPFFGLHYITDILVGSIIGIVGSVPFVFWFENLSVKETVTDEVLKKFILCATIAAAFILVLSIWANF